MVLLQHNIFEKIQLGKSLSSVKDSVIKQIKKRWGIIFKDQRTIHCSVPWPGALGTPLCRESCTCRKWSPNLLCLLQYSRLRSLEEKKSLSMESMQLRKRPLQSLVAFLYGIKHGVCQEVRDTVCSPACTSLSAYTDICGFSWLLYLVMVSILHSSFIWSVGW